ncbi:MAG: DUF2299 domain-containing protein [archaeon]|nr:DUF2299 domain-containing protein [archaeon]
MTKSEQNKTIEQKIIDYCTEEGILRDKISGEEDKKKIHFGYNIVFPPNHPQPKKMVLLQPKNKNSIVIQSGTQISSANKQFFQQNPKKKLIFFEILKRFLLSKDIMFNIDIKQDRFLVSDQIYEDGLTMNEFFKSIRKVFNSSVYGNLLLSDIISGKGGNKNIPKSDESTSKTDYSQDGLFYT